MVDARSEAVAIFEDKVSKLEASENPDDREQARIMRDMVGSDPGKFFEDLAQKIVATLIEETLPALQEIFASATPEMRGTLHTGGLAKAYQEYAAEAEADAARYLNAEPRSEGLATVRLRDAAILKRMAEEARNGK